MCTVSPPAVQAPPSGVVQHDGNFAFIATSLASLDDARAQYDLPLLLPTAIPSGYELGPIRYFHAASPQFDSLTICYLDPDGHYLEIDQGFPVPQPGATAYDLTPEDEKGIATVRGRQAYWTLGVLTGAPSGSDIPNLTWQPGSLRLGWSTDIPVPGDVGAFTFSSDSGEWLPVLPQYVGFQLESDTLSLDALIAIANSVQPYTPRALSNPNSAP